MLQKLSAGGGGAPRTTSISYSAKVCNGVDTLNKNKQYKCGKCQKVGGIHHPTKIPFKIKCTRILS